MEQAGVNMKQTAGPAPTRRPGEPLAQTEKADELHAWALSSEATAQQRSVKGLDPHGQTLLSHPNPRGIYLGV